MKNFYDQNEDKLRSKLHNHEFSFSPNAWEDMAKRLDKAEGGRAAGGWWKWMWVSVGAVLGTTGIGLGLYFGSSDSQELALVQANTANVDITTKLNPQPEVKKQPQTPIVTVASTPTIQTKNTATRSTAATTNTRLAAPVQPVLNTITAPVVATNNQTAVLIPNETMPLEGASDENETPEGRTVTRITRVTHVYSMSPLRLRMDSVASVKIRQAQQDTDTSLFHLDRIPNKWKSRWKAGVVGGVTGKQYTDGAKGVSGFAGGFVQYKIAAMHGIEMGLQYKHLPHWMGKDFPKNYTTDAIQWGASGEQLPTQVATLRDLHLVELPFAYRFSPHRKHHVLLGAKGSYLLALRAHASKAEMDYSKKALGLRSLNASLFFGYEFSLCDHLNLGFQYNLGLLNWMTNNETLLSAQWADSAELQSVPTAVEPQKVVEMPRKLYDNDLQVFMKYTF